MGAVSEKNLQDHDDDVLFALLGSAGNSLPPLSPAVWTLPGPRRHLGRNPTVFAASFGPGFRLECGNCDLAAELLRLLLCCRLCLRGAVGSWPEREKVKGSRREGETEGWNAKLRRERAGSSRKWSGTVSVTRTEGVDVVWRILRCDGNTRVGACCVVRVPRVWCP